LGYQRETHDDVASDYKPEVALVKDEWHACGQHQRAGHDDKDAKAVHDVIGVICRGEPGEVHPGKPDRQENQRIAQQRGKANAFNDRVVKSFGRQGNGHNDDEVKEQLERCRPAGQLCRIASAHRRSEVRVECASQRSLAHCHLQVRDSARFSGHGLRRDFPRLEIGEGFAALSCGGWNMNGGCAVASTNAGAAGSRTGVVAVTLRVCDTALPVSNPPDNQCARTAYL